MHGTLRHDTTLACSRAPKPVRVRRAHQGAATTPPPLPSPSHDATSGPYRCFSSIAFHLSPASPASPSTCPRPPRRLIKEIPSRRSQQGYPIKEIPTPHIPAPGAAAVWSAARSVSSTHRRHIPASTLASHASTPPRPSRPPPLPPRLARTRRHSPCCTRRLTRRKRRPRGSSFYWAA